MESVKEHLKYLPDYFVPSKDHRIDLHEIINFDDLRSIFFVLLSIPHIVKLSVFGKTQKSFLPHYRPKILVTYAPSARYRESFFHHIPSIGRSTIPRHTLHAR